jgi:hypothetical protein
MYVRAGFTENLMDACDSFRREPGNEGVAHTFSLGAQLITYAKNKYLEIRCKHWALAQCSRLDGGLISAPVVSCLVRIIRECILS